MFWLLLREAVVAHFLFRQPRSQPRVVFSNRHDGVIVLKQMRMIWMKMMTFLKLSRGKTRWNATWFELNYLDKASAPFPSLNLASLHVMNFCSFRPPPPSYIVCISFLGFLLLESFASQWQHQASYRSWIQYSLKQ